MDSRLEQLILRHTAQDKGLSLSEWLLRQICFTVSTLCLFVILPLSLCEPNLPVFLNVAIIVFGLFSLFCFVESKKGRTRIRLFLTGVITVLNLVWFYGGGTSGSTNFYFFGAELLPLIFFRGWTRWLLMGFILADVCLLNIAGYNWPALVTPFHSPWEEVLDVVIGLVCGFSIIAAVVWVLVTSYDLESKRLFTAAKELSASEEKFSKAFRAMANGMGIAELNSGRFLEVNDAFCRVYGFSRAEVIGHTATELGLWKSSEERERFIERLRAAGSLRDIELLKYNRAGEAKFILLNAEIVEIAGNECVISLIQDITERKRHEQDMAHSLALLRATIESTDDGILTVGADGQIISFNTPFVKMWRIPEEILAMKNDRRALEFVLDQLELPEQFLAKVQYLYEHPTEESFDTLDFKDHRVFERYSRPMLVDGQATGRVWSFRNVTARKQSDALANDQKRVLEMIANDASIGEIFDSLIRVVEANGGGMLCSILLLDNDGRHLRHGAAPSLPKVYTDAIDGVTIGPEVGSCGTAAFRRQPVFVADIATDPLWENYKAVALPHGLQACWSTPIFDARQTVLGTFAMYYHQPGLPDAKQQRLIDLAKQTAAIAIGRERARVALQISEAKLLQSQKMEAIGQLAGGVAHDFNNILSALLMQAEIMGSIKELPDEARAGLQEICADVNRAAELTRQLLLFSRRQVMQPRLLNLNELILNLGKMLQRIVRANVQLQLHLHSAPLMTRADAGMIEQILVNLVVNGCDAMPVGGSLRIETQEVIVDKATANLYADAYPGRYVCLSVSDTGTGIPPEILPQIFEPFFTTKEPGKGTGLGLATVFGIVKQHGGWIRVDNRPGSGATFNIFLPASTAPDVESHSTVALPTPPGGSETILLVEDDASVRKLTRKLLERSGYTLLEAANGPEAVKVWSENSKSVALLLTDLMMPGGIGGQELARQLQAENPALKVVFVSGYSADNAGKEFSLRTGEIFLQKPFATEQLLEKIRQLLDA
jgi:PAS domain S-box-containing protein